MPRVAACPSQTAPPNSQIKSTSSIWHLKKKKKPLGSKVLFKKKVQIKQGGKGLSRGSKSNNETYVVKITR